MKIALGLTMALLVGLGAGAATYAAPTARAARPVTVAAAAPDALAPHTKLETSVRPLSGDPALHSLVIDLHYPVSASDYSALEAAGAKITGRYPSIASAVVNVPGTAVLDLAALPQVVRISSRVTSGEADQFVCAN